MYASIALETTVLTQHAVLMNLISQSRKHFISKISITSRLFLLNTTVSENLSGYSLKYSYLDSNPMQSKMDETVCFLR